MKHFYILARDEQEKEQCFVKEIVDYINLKGGQATLDVNPDDDDIEREIHVPESAECILAIGGDGTLIRAAQNTFGSKVPLLGINRGHLGYLCDLDEDSVYNAIDRLFVDDYEVEERMMISGYIKNNDDAAINEVCALNDIVICSTGGLQVIQLTVYVNGKYLYSYNCDGMIFSTPTGSTAYNLSANGPIVNPITNLILITPINPHTLNARSIVLDSEDEIVVDIRPRKADGTDTAEVSFDGNHKQLLKQGQQLVVHKTTEKSQMIRLSNVSFLERIRTKMQES